jgi:hypothetical protein
MGFKREECWTEQQRNTLWRMRQNRHNLTDIASRIGRTREACKTQLYRMRRAIRLQEQQNGN